MSNKVNNFYVPKLKEVGEPLTIRRVYCKKGNYKAEVVRTLYDTVIYSYPLIVSRMEEGCFDFVSSTNITPNVPSGKYVLKSEVVYKPNPIREIRYVMESEEFEIINE